ncbi:MAG TPA: hypothetical protein VNZ52_06020 [Candidatus Thermoplasmatota archaeon]|nr:hypothetical protein [Candidatus Thermoplasmatota archaeon]
MAAASETYVGRMEKALIETVILHELRNTPDCTLDQLVMSVRNVGGWTGKVDEATVLDCLRRLDRDGHIEEQDDRYSLSEEGRDDIKKADFLFRNVGASLGVPAGGARSSGGSRRGL